MSLARLRNLGGVAIIIAFVILICAAIPWYAQVVLLIVAGGLILWTMPERP